MTVSPESTRALTRRSLRERSRAHGEQADDGQETSVADGSQDTSAAPDGAVPVAPARDDDTDLVDVDDETTVPETGPPRGRAADPADAAPIAATALFGPDEGEAPPESLSEPHSDGDSNPEVHDEREPVRAWADETHPTTALTWLDPRRVAVADAADAEASDLFAGARLTPGWRRPRVLFPVGIVAALCASYVATTLLWPLHEVPPTITATQVEIDPAPAATATAPAQGSAAVAVEGIAPLASTTSQDEIASITKVASVLMVLDELPLEVGEQGPSFAFTYADSRDYWSYRRANQSSLDVPVGASLTEYQMLQGILLGSANNYIDRLSDELWGSDRAFAAASATWLRDHGISGVTLVTPSGFDSGNVATPAGLVQLGELAMKNPVFAEIVGTRSAEIPGVGTVTNTNGMLKDAGVVGVKTGTLSHWNLLTAKEVQVGENTVRLFAAVLGQDSNKARLAVTRSLFAEVEESLAEQPVSVPAGTVVGQVTTEWGAEVDVVTDADARVVLWNGASATATASLDLGARTTAGAEAGTLTAEGPIDSAETSVSLADDVPAPSLWWRLTHPLELFGLDKD
ncbi:D-alanyl-D-alanine carboxypeptidase family protein [Microbacterium sp. NPDC058342]|uniref:D-alanyl-D-alanine carboxypeptidase family protein n=1 Tax=Microbacterium sp. NPDC058342 TaxID=3346454 RepID=UPI003660D697